MKRKMSRKEVENFMIWNWIDAPHNHPSMKKENIIYTIMCAGALLLLVGLISIT